MRRGDAGYTLIEMLIVAALLLVVVSGTMSLYTLTAKDESRTAEWTLALQQGRVGMERMIRDLRQADSVISPSGTSAGGGTGLTANYVDFNITYGSPPAVQVAYECDVASSVTPYKKCARWQGATTATAPYGSGNAAWSTSTATIPEIESTGHVFTFTYPDSSTNTGPYFIGATILIPSRGTLNASPNLGHDANLTDGAFLNNSGSTGGVG